MSDIINISDEFIITVRHLGDDREARIYDNTGSLLYTAKAVGALGAAEFEFDGNLYTSKSGSIDIVRNTDNRLACVLMNIDGRLTFIKECRNHSVSILRSDVGDSEYVAIVKRGFKSKETDVKIIKDGTQIGNIKLDGRIELIQLLADTEGSMFIVANGYNEIPDGSNEVSSIQDNCNNLIRQYNSLWESRDDNRFYWAQGKSYSSGAMVIPILEVRSNKGYIVDEKQSARNRINSLDNLSRNTEFEQFDILLDVSKWTKMLQIK
jgi:hypothetical protein